MVSISWYNLSITVIWFLEHLLKYCFILVGPQSNLTLKPHLQQDRWNDSYSYAFPSACVYLPHNHYVKEKCTTKVHTQVHWHEYLQSFPWLQQHNTFHIVVLARCAFIHTLQMRKQGTVKWSKMICPRSNRKRVTKPGTDLLIPESQASTYLQVYFWCLTVLPIQYLSLDPLTPSGWKAIHTIISIFKMQNQKRKPCAEGKYFKGLTTPLHHWRNEAGTQHHLYFRQWRQKKYHKKDSNLESSDI